jgi:Ca2+ transporting ATPase
MEAAYLYTTQEVLKHFEVAEEKGLSDEQAKSSLAKYGRNGTVYRLSVPGWQSYC